LLLFAAATTPGCTLFRPVGLEDKPVAEEAVETPVPPPVDDTVPVIYDVSLVDPEQPEPRLLPENEDEEVSPEALLAGIREAETLSALLTGRELSADLRDQVESGRALLGDARKALVEQDLERAGVLLDKCLVLLHDAESASRA
jgi:hypothetical protein